MSEDWTGREPTAESPYYPFYKVVNANTMAGAEELPYIITKYLMDLPSRGYTPPSDNRFPRARLKKLLYWDCPLPLNQPLPTTEQMQSIQFDPEHPADPPDKQRGYRIYSQELVRQAQVEPQSIIRVYPGNLQRVWEKNEFVFRQTIITTVMVNYGIEGNMQTTSASRAYAIMQAIIEATEGVNFGGIGGMITQHVTKFDDERNNTGYKIYQTIDWNGEGANQNYATA